MSGDYSDEAVAPRACGAGILGIGMAVPERVLTNADLERMVDTTDEWIISRTGIRERRVAAATESTSDFGIAASRSALADADLDPSQIDLVLCATCSGDYPWPATACIIQDAVGAKNAAAFDLSAACAGFCYGLAVAASLIMAGTHRYVLLVGADTLTRYVDWFDRSTCILFGDGAGAAVIGPCDKNEGVLGSCLGSDGSHVESLYVPAGGSRCPLTSIALEQRLDKMVMRGREVFRFAVRIMGEASLSVLSNVGMSIEDVDLFIPHQANTRIIRAAAERMKLPPEKVFENVERYGNTSAASVPIALAEAVNGGKVRRGDVLVFVAFGAGLSWAANVVRWCRD